LSKSCLALQTCRLTPETNYLNNNSLPIWRAFYLCKDGLHKSSELEPVLDGSPEKGLIPPAPMIERRTWGPVMCRNRAVNTDDRQAVDLVSLSIQELLDLAGSGLAQRVQLVITHCQQECSRLRRHGGDVHVDALVLGCRTEPPHGIDTGRIE